jgi:uncharacterized zinc-type alcohol dehydrogenase-like protein
VSSLVVLCSALVAVRLGARCDPASATAPLLCAGITTFSPMQHWKLTPGQRLGVVGLGGLVRYRLVIDLAAGRKERP